MKAGKQERKIKIKEETRRYEDSVDERKKQKRDRELEINEKDKREA